jgi:hypothetical protein
MSQPVAPSSRQGSRPDPSLLANAQRLTIHLVGAILALGVAKWMLVGLLSAPAWIGALMTLMQVGLWGASIWAVWKLAQACRLSNNASLAHALGMFVPIVNLVVLVLLNMRAGKILQEAGVKAGFLGVSKAEMKKLAGAKCSSCGYRSRGVSTGECPECRASLRAKEAA